MLLVLHLVTAGGTTATLAADMLARGIDELLFCLLTIAFYRYWSLGTRTP